MIDSQPSRFSRLGLSLNARLGELERQRLLQYLALFGIALVGAFLRFYKMGAWGIWIDEALEMNYARQAVQNFPVLTRVSLLFTGWVMGLLGTGEASIRLASALAGMLTLPALYFPFKKLFGPAVALLAVLFLALSPWHLYWSQNARFYTLLLLFFSLGQLFFFFWLETDRLGYLVLAGIFLALAVQESMVAALIGPAILLYLALIRALNFDRPAGFRLRNFLGLAVPAVAAVAFVAVQTDFVGAIQTMIAGHQHNPVRVLLSIVSDVGLPMFVAALLGGAYLIARKNRAGLYLLSGALVPVLSLVAIAPFAQIFSRYVFMTLPAFALLAAVAARELFSQAQKHTRLLALGLVLILLADAASQDVLYYGFQNGNREDFKGAFNLVTRQWKPGDQVISTRPEVGAYYLNREVGDSQKLDLKRMDALAARTWFVIDSRTYVSPDFQQWLDEHTALKGVNDVYVAGKQMMMRTYLFRPAQQGGQP